MSATEATPAIRTAARQIIRFSNIDDVLRLADVIIASGSYPKDANKFKLAMMLMAGAEVGFGPAQSMRFVTPPIDGKCNLYGDSGLALVYQSGQLDGGIREWIEGDSDDRKAFCTLKRVGQPERSFEYPITTAKKLVSYRKALEKKIGPWHDDPDNMLRRRVLWKALNAVFADVLNGMTADDVAEDEAISVEATYTPRTAAAPALPPASPPPAALPPVDAQPVMSDEQFAEVARLRQCVRENHGGDGAAEWKAFLLPFAVDTVKALTPAQADEFIQAVGSKYDPFTYPFLPAT